MRLFITASTIALAAAVTGLGLTGFATAADMPEYPPIIEPPEPTPLPMSGEWYLRGDIGYKIYDGPDGRYDATGYGDMTANSLDDTGVIGVGVGYRVNEYLRLDATIDYEFESEMSGRLPCPGACGTTLESANLDAWTGLINAYVDMGNYNGLTPYVGAGIGASLLKTDGVTSSTAGNYYGADTWNLSWALMAGVGYEVAEGLTLDLNYRYLHLGDAETKFTSGTGTTETLEWNDIGAHEMRVGMRYAFY